MNEIEGDSTSPELLNENSEVVLPISSVPMSIPSTSKPNKKLGFKLKSTYHQISSTK